MTTFNPTPLGNPNLTHRRPTTLDRFWFGATYYPEHWSPIDRAQDADRMAEAGFNVARMAEFAWDLMEPQEGTFDFSLFDETIAHLGAKGIYTILCTPTATPPRWLSKKHPQMLRVNADGVPLQHGSRQHACHASPVFRDYSRRITQAMADHYKDNPFVIGWQTDNEFFCHFAECHCANCQVEFGRYLAERYDGQIANLNTAWGTAFWSQTYADFADIPTPRSAKPTYENPSHRLDYTRYLSASVTLFQHDQVAILRQTQPNWFVTHNGVYQHIDYAGLFTQDLDFLGLDLYPFFDLDPETRPFSHAFNLDKARSHSGNFIILEQQAGPGGQQPYFHDNPEPGEMRRLMYSSIARGADSFLHFRWRTCRFGAEIYWCGLLDHDNVPRRRYEEARQEGQEMKRIGPAVLGTAVHVEAAVAAGDVNEKNAHQAFALGLPDSDAIAAEIHRSLMAQGFATGVVHPADDLTGLKLLVIPHWAYWDSDWVADLETFVQQGGTLVIGARTATRNTNNTVIAETVPGCLRTLTGVTVEEYGRQNNPEKRPLTIHLGNQVIPTTLWYETVTLDTGSEAIATWEGRHLSGQNAIAMRQHGAGTVVYVGTYLTTQIWDALLPMLIDCAQLRPLWPAAPEGVEVVLRKNDRHAVWFLINHSDADVLIPATPPGQNLITQTVSGPALTLGRHAVAVIMTGDD
jgi:beta-galactosidase